MMRDEELRSTLDYSEGQKAAAHRVLVELINLFDEYRDAIRIVGGWVPDLMFPGEGHVGSVDVDILAGMYGGTQEKKRSQHVQGIKALKATGGNFAFEFAPQTVKIEAERTDGAMVAAKVNVIAVVPYFVMKTAAMGRGKAKDAYDLYFLIKHYADGIEGLAQLFEDYKETSIIQEMKAKLNDKFASPNHAGPVDVAAFLDLLDEDEIAFTKRDAYEQVQALIRKI